MTFSLSRHIGTIALILSGIAFLILMYMLYWPIRILEPRTQPYHVIVKTIAAGKPILYEVDSCKYVNLPALTTRELISDTNVRVNLNSSTTNVQQGCSKVLVASTSVPVGTPPGRYHLNITLSYQINSFRTEVVRVSTESFTITQGGL